MERVRKMVRGILKEIMDKTNVYTSFLAAKKHLGKPNMYLHFTNVYKLGINPKKSHADPHAVYFYPVDWILDEYNWHTFQYAVTMDYFFLAQVDTKNFLRIDTLDWNKVEYLMDQAGLLQYWHRYRSDFDKKNAARNFWEFLDMMNVSPKDRDNPDHHNIPQVKWNAFWKTTGYDGFTDKKGVVNSDEPSQIGVFNPRRIKIVESGPNEDVRSEYMQFYNEVIEQHGIDVKQQGYIENGKAYRIYGLVDGKALDIRIYPEEYGGIVYYSDADGNLYKAQTEGTFDAAQGRNAMHSAIKSAINKAESGVVNIERINTLKNAADVIFNKVSPYEFKSFRTSSSIGIKPLEYFKRDDRNTNYNMFLGGLKFEGGQLVVEFTFSVAKQVLLKDPLEIYADIIDANPDAGDEVWHEELKKYGINPDTFNYENTDDVEEPVFRYKMKVEDPEGALTKIQTDFEQWLSKYNWPPGNPSAKVSWKRQSTASKVKGWFYQSINKG
jgi:hypothetical protein